MASVPANPPKCWDMYLTHIHVCTGEIRNGEAAVLTSPSPMSKETELGEGSAFGNSISGQTVKLSIALQDQFQHPSSTNIVSPPVQRYCR